ncbi:uncharacterized protein LOC126554984 [Aphis gossypii]|uniref:uncharacterized protein LOC126554984 n=1 Tax=Aphis gossypii TaxID=80765 RepID=UPI002158E0BD|nr:uncharacterized protein LOC126554984 [Aphis gossypii]
MLNIVVHNSDGESCSPISSTSGTDNYSQVIYRTPSTPKRKKVELSSEVTSPKICPKKKLIWNSSRFGDLSLRDFETPNRAARNFKVLKTTVSQLRRKNKNLKQKCKRLEKKVETLNDLLEILKKKSLMTDFAADNLKVPIIILILIVYL